MTEIAQAYTWSCKLSANGCRHKPRKSSGTCGGHCWWRGSRAGDACLRREQARTSLKPHGLAKLDALVLGEDLGRHAAEGAEHRPPGVDELELAVAPERLGVRGEARGVLQGTGSALCMRR